MEVRLLGPLEVSDGERLLRLSARPGAVLTLLALRPWDTVSADRLIEALWGSRPPPSARAALQMHVSKLRRALGGAAIGSSSSGYELRLKREQVDALRFERLARAALEAVAS